MQMEPNCYAHSWFMPQCYHALSDSSIADASHKIRIGLQSRTCTMKHDPCPCPCVRHALCLQGWPGMSHVLLVPCESYFTDASLRCTACTCDAVCVSQAC